MLASPASLGFKRAVFASQPIWVTRYRDEELFAAGEFTNQSHGARGVESWVGRRDRVEDEDVVLWHSMFFFYFIYFFLFLILSPFLPFSKVRNANSAAFGLTHNPRIEDFPVMPMEKVSVMLRPDGFFTKNPALDVPPSNWGFNKSTLFTEDTKTAGCRASGAGSRAKLFKRVE